MDKKNHSGSTILKRTMIIDKSEILEEIKRNNTKE